MCSDLADTVKIPMFIATDQEGGTVSRLATGTQMPGNMALGATRDPQLTKQAALVMGNELKALGINTDFAPVLDVNVNPANPVIGVRSFSSDPQLVSMMGTAFIDGLHEAGVLSALKHFPGHGDTAIDSHIGLPVIDKSLEELWQCELIPFKAAIEQGADMVMTAHICYPQIENETYGTSEGDVTLPATMSSEILTDLLRGELGFEGLIVTDALNMYAIAQFFSEMDAAKMTINAGADILLMPFDIGSLARIAHAGEYINGIAAMVENGEIPLARIDESVRRILETKKKNNLFKADGRARDEKIAAATAEVGSAQNHSTEMDIAKRSITLLRNRDNVLPLRDQNVLLLAHDDTETNSLQYAVSTMKETGDLSCHVLIDTYEDKSLGEISSLMYGCDTVAMISEIFSASYLNPESERGGDCAKVDSIVNMAHNVGKNAVVISCYLPYDAARYDADAILAAYSTKGMSQDPRDSTGDLPQYGPNIPAAVFTLFGNSSPQGKIPVDIPYLTPSYDYADSILFEIGTGMAYGE